MPRPNYLRTYAAEAEQSINDLLRFGIETAPPAPDYLAFIGAFANATITLLHGLLERSRVLQVHGNDVDADQFEVATVMLHRAFYSSFAGTLEGACKLFCESRGGAVRRTGPYDSYKFQDYLTGAFAVSTLPAARRAHWDALFRGVAVIRNKASHYDQTLTNHERALILGANLGHHISAEGTAQTRTANYAPLAASALDFLRELEASPAPPR